MMNSESGALMRRHLRIILRQSVMLLAEELTFEGQMASWVIASSKFARISFADAACSFYRPDRVIAKSLAGVRYPCSRSRAPPMEQQVDVFIAAPSRAAATRSPTSGQIAFSPVSDTRMQIAGGGSNMPLASPSH